LEALERPDFQVSRRCVDECIERHTAPVTVLLLGHTDPARRPVGSRSSPSNPKELTMSSTPELQTHVLLRSEQSAGHVSVMENVVRAGSAGPPLHRHDFDEGFYMLEGELIFQIGDERFTRRTGEFAFAARNVVHALANHSDADARYLLVCTPAGLERHFERAAAEAQGIEPPGWALQPSPEITIVGPQITREG
jgi:quercetin dioxygenase-like cupin family protein